MTTVTATKLERMNAKIAEIRDQERSEVRLLRDLLATRGAALDMANVAQLDKMLALDDADFDVCLDRLAMLMPTEGNA